jgi:hypothetical protein
MTEPEVAIVFTPEVWVEELHRHLTDHGGARIRQIVVEPDVALEEEYDVLVVSHRWAALTHGFVSEIHARARLVLGVFDREEPGARGHLVSLGVDDVIESDRGPGAVTEALRRLRTRRSARTNTDVVSRTEPRRGRVVLVGGPPATGRTEIALQLASTLGAPVVDADDVSPSVAARLQLPVEPNLRTAIDAVEHGHGELTDALITVARTPLTVCPGLPNPSGWSQVRPGEVVRVVDQIAREMPFVVVDSAAPLEDLVMTPRGRNGVARALMTEADVIVGVCLANPVGLARFLSWSVEVRYLAATTPLLVVVNRATSSRFERGELYDELTRSLHAVDVVFASEDRRVHDAMWDGRMPRNGPFTRAVDRVAECVRSMHTVDVDEEEPTWELAS